MQNQQDACADLDANVDPDANVLEVLPPKCKVLDFENLKTAEWTKAARIKVCLENGSEKSYFLKTASEEQGRQMIQGEWASVNEILAISPALTPTPYATGQFRDASVPTYFFLMEFLDMKTGAPKAPDICKALADLHARSTSPTGKFGYHMVTCHGPHPQATIWDDSWSDFFARLLRQFHDREMRRNGPTEEGEYETEMDKLITYTVPKLLRPLQAEGRYLKPSLVHGDLWEENCGTECGTGKPKIFDPAVFYGHNEYDLGTWRRKRVKFKQPHREEYRRHMPESEPIDQWDDRNRLYCIKFEIAHSIGWPKDCEEQRTIIMHHMVYLNQKYSGDDAVIVGAGTSDKA